ncbi:hypothetical protein PVA45_03945 [Entomospira entomophila]|uniref:Uncharacterized protein n=1 Tax=Entomospira entomophila TaxID=2719988 RepID=A0A968KRE4_9SPIO|nr:hypothetical protein [Entomospira entomophilus]NIZ40663.1 hypothetical protein [Entomospira entomophilus]WDI34877.1 hypothetical protein PVA45_03945 [Entomospira entomophilus]
MTKTLKMMIVGLLLTSLFTCEQQLPTVLLEKEASLAIIQDHGYIRYGLFVKLLYADSSELIIPDSLRIEHRQRELEWAIHTGIKRNYDGTLLVNTMLLASSYDDLHGDFLITWREPMGKIHAESMMVEKQQILLEDNFHWSQDEFHYLSMNNVHIEYSIIEELNIVLIRVLD